MLRAALISLIAVLLAACGGTQSGQTFGNDNNTPADANVPDFQGATVTYYKDTKPLFDTKCAICHHEGGIAPFPLTDYPNAFERMDWIRTMVSEKRMPPWPADDSCREYKHKLSLNQDQIDTIVAWVDQGGAPGDPADEPKPGQQGSGLARVDLTLRVDKPYTPRLAPDDYHCFLLEWPHDATKFITGFRAVPGESRVVHHVIAYLAPPDQVDKIKQLDSQDPTVQGYTCYGGPGANLNWIGGWAPGGRGGEFPAGTGIQVEPGSLVVLQVHYNALNAGKLPDQTGIEFTLEDSVDKVARVIPFTNPGWLGGSSMLIPKDNPDVTHSFAADLTGGQFTMVLHNAMLHMHQLGKKGRIAIKRADGSEDCVLDIPNWRFHWQLTYTFETPIKVHPGDRVYLECTWDNSPDHQPDFGAGSLPSRDVTWGDGTTDEMCLGVFFVTYEL